MMNFLKFALPGLFMQKGILGAVAGGIASSVVGGLMGGSDDGSRTTTMSLPEWIREPSQQNLERAQEAVHGMDFIPMSPEQRQSLNLQTGFANQLLPQTQGLQPGTTLAGAGDLARRTMAGDFLSPSSNPFLRENLDVLSGQITDTFQRDILPQIGSQAQRSGAFGGARQGLAEARAADEVSQNIGDVTSQFLQQNLARERAAQTQAMQMAPTLARSGIEVGMMPAEILGNVGNTRRSFDVAREEFPVQQEQMITDFISSLRPSAGSTQETSGPGRGLGAMQGALGGLQIFTGVRDLFQNNNDNELFGGFTRSPHPGT